MLMSRPFILPSGVLAYALGVAMAYGTTGQVAWPAMWAGLAVTMLANLCAHYADEYADVDTDTLARHTWFSGGSGVLPAGEVSPLLALRAALLLAGFTVLLCGWAIVAGLLPPAAAWIVGLGLVGGWYYSMPPLALERRGLGELDNALLGGLLMPLMGYTSQTGAPSVGAALALVPIVASVMLCLLGVHWADRRADAAVGKRSLVVILGQRSRLAHHLLTLFTYTAALALLPWPVAAAVLFTLPLGLWATWRFGHSESPFASATVMVAVMVAAGVGWIFLR